MNMKNYLLRNGFTQTHNERFVKGNMVIFSTRNKAGSLQTEKVWVIAIDGKELYNGTNSNIKCVLRNQYKFTK